MNEETILALEGSIDKWEKMETYLRYKRKLTYNQILYLTTILEQGSRNCPLCQINRVSCKNCPIAARDFFRFGGCSDTPYIDYNQATKQLYLLHDNNNTLNNVKIAIKKEVKFLKSFRED